MAIFKKKEEPVKEGEHIVGNGLSKKQIREIHMRNMNKEEIAYLKRKEAMDKVWPVARFFILFGLCFIIDDFLSSRKTGKRRLKI